MSAIPYRVRRSDRARRTRVSVLPEGEVEVVLPRRAAERDAAAAVRELGGWIERRLAEQERARDELRGEPGTLSFAGESLRLIPQLGRSRAHRRGNELLIPADDPGPALERFYRREARAELETRVRRAADAVGVSFTAISVRAQRTRWGSCSASGALSFNWRLLLAPEPVLDYVIWHEVCHLARRDHSPRFWQLVARYCPDHREQARWLARYGSALALPV